MPSYKTVDSKTMITAADSGQQGIRAQADRDQRAHESSAQESLQRSEGIARTIQTHNQQEEQQRSNMAQEGLQERQLAETVRRNRMGEAIQQDQQDIEAADKGVESQGPSRADSLRKEMERGAQQTGGGKGQAGAQQTGGGTGGPMQSPEDQAAEARGQQQGEKPLEVAGPDRRTYAPTEERKAQEGSKLTTNRLNAQANYLNATRNFAEAKLKGSTEGMEKEAKNLQQPIKEAARMFDLGKKGELQPNQWEDVTALAKDAPDPALQQEIETRQWGPALSRFMQSRVGQSSLQFMAVTGDIPDGDLVDFASPVMREFTENAGQMQAYLRTADANGLLSGVLGVQSMADRNKLVRKLTAQAMLNQKSQLKSSGGGALIPSQGGQSARNAAAGPDQNPAGSVQRGLVQREQATIDKQTAADQLKERDTRREQKQREHPSESYTRSGIRIPR
jgi:hypothetical protein